MDLVIPVSWTTAVGATTYVLWKGTVDDPALATNIAILATTNYFDPVMPPCMPYYYWVQSTNQYGISGLGHVGSGWRALYAPGPVNASDGGAYTTKIHVAWGGVPPYASSYQLWRNDIADIYSASQLVYTYETEFEDTAVTRGATYYTGPTSPSTTAWRFTGPDAGGTPALMPTGLRASKGKYADRIDVSWTPAFGATSYRLLRGTTLDPTFAEYLDTVVGTNYVDRNTQPGVTYYYWAQSVNNYGISSSSGTDGGWVALSPPGAIDASDGFYTNRVLVQWLPAAGATTYELWRGTENDAAKASRIVFTTDLKYNDTIVDPGILYYYWVKAKTTVFTSGFATATAGTAAAAG